MLKRVGAPIFSGLAGDIGGPAVLLGSTGLGGITLLWVVSSRPGDSADITQSRSRLLPAPTMAYLPRPHRIHLCSLTLDLLDLCAHSSEPSEQFSTR